MNNWKFWTILGVVVIGLTLVTHYIAMKMEDKKMSDLLDMIEGGTNEVAVVN